MGTVLADIVPGVSSRLISGQLPVGGQPVKAFMILAKA